MDEKKISKSIPYKAVNYKVKKLRSLIVKHLECRNAFISSHQQIEYKLAQINCLMRREISYKELHAELCVIKNYNPDSLIKDNALCLFMKDPKSTELLSRISLYRLPILKTIGITGVPEECKPLNQFLIYSTPDKLQRLVFSCSESLRFSCTNYIYSLEFAARRVSKVFCLIFMKITCLEFCSIVSACKNTESIILQTCEIITNTKCEFKNMHSSTIANLNLYRSGLSDYSNWNDYPERFENIIIGVFNCQDLLKSIKNIQ